MEPHRSYVRWWRAVHLWGLACLLVGGWAFYYAAVALLEAIAFVVRRKRGDTWSEVVWSFLYDRYGRLSDWRVLLVAAWTLYFCGAFIVTTPWFGPAIDAPLGFIVLLVLWGHFFHDHKSDRRPHG